ncbi:MAG: hypothetical protein GX759_06355 [Thermoanaerobacterales bacterium]|jgi:hypothetical protein|nr:hypothetical protein [Thermoanaerobacterales bacterium]
MVSKMQLKSVGQMCPGYMYAGDATWMPSMVVNEAPVVSCETCIHWEKERCNIDLFDKVLTSLDQT